MIEDYYVRGIEPLHFANIEAVEKALAMQQKKDWRQTRRLRRDRYWRLMKMSSRKLKQLWKGKRREPPFKNRFEWIKYGEKETWECFNYAKISRETRALEPISADLLDYATEEDVFELTSDEDMLDTTEEEDLFEPTSDEDMLDITWEEDSELESA